MSMLWFTLIFVFFSAAMARYMSVHPVPVPASVRPSRFYAGLAAVCLATVAGLRNNIGDTFLYMHSYRVDDFSWEAVLQKRDIGFNVLQMLLKLLSDDPQIMIATTAVVTNVIIVAVFYHYARLFEISMYVYIASGAFIVSMNGIRQYLTAAIVFGATKALVDGKWKLYFAVVLFASLFHLSAIILLPIYFIVRRRAWTKTTLLLLALGIGIVVGFNAFSSALFTVIGGTQYGSYETFDGEGANIIRVAVYMIPLLIAFMGREKLRELFPGSDTIVNMSVIGAVLMIISTQNWIFARLGIYFSLYQLLLLGWIVKLFRDKDQRIVYLALITFYLVYFFYENVIVLDMWYGSDYIRWPF